MLFYLLRCINMLSFAVVPHSSLIRSFSCAVVCGSSPSFSPAVYHSFVCLSHFVNLSFFVGEHLGYFQLGAITHSAADRCSFIASQLQIYVSPSSFVTLELDSEHFFLLLDLSLEGSGKDPGVEGRASLPGSECFPALGLWHDC